MDAWKGEKKQYFVISDGHTPALFIVDPVEFKVKDIVRVKYPDGRGVMWMNELEYINGTIMANVYTKKFIVLVDLNTGKVKRTLDFSALASQADQILRQKRGVGLANDEVLNGIAWRKADPKRNVSEKLLITGKMWPIIAEVELTKPISPS